MAALKTAKFVLELPRRPSNHKEISCPIPTLVSDENFGNLGFNTYWEAITVPFVHAPASHKHDFPQYLFFLGGDITNLMELDAEIELNLSEDGKNLEKHIITKATSIYVPPGLYHGPLIYKRVTKPILFIDLYFSKKYERKT
jgi:hypothetical protein